MHWIYDEEELSKRGYWLGKFKCSSKAVWHQGKSAGEFTHYGDQIFGYMSF